MAKHIQTHIWIDSPPAVVWKILTDFSSYEAWNPFIFKLEGPLEKGGNLTVTIQPPGASPMTFSPTLSELNPPSSLIWKGRFLVRGLFDGEHAFRLDPEGAGTRLIHEEKFSGILPSLMPPSFFEKTRRGFEMMNAALKERAEKNP